METTAPIRIPNPTKDLVAFIEKANLRKKERLASMRDNFLKTEQSKN